MAHLSVALEIEISDEIAQLGEAGFVSVGAADDRQAPRVRAVSAHFREGAEQDVHALARDEIRHGEKLQRRRGAWGRLA